MRNQKRWAALLLAAVMVFADVMPAGAVENSVKEDEAIQETILEEPEEVPELVIEAVDEEIVENAEISIEEVVDAEDAELVISDEIVVTEEGELSENNSVEDTSEEAVDISEEAAEETFEICGLSEDDFELSEEQLQEKSDMSDMLPGLRNAKAGIDYVEDIVFFYSSSEDEAKEIAKAVGGEFVSLEYGVAEIKLVKSVTVEDVVLASSEMDMNLPAIYPNYYVKAYDVEDNELTGAYDSYDPYTLSDSDYYQWFHDVIGSKYAWDEGYTGQGIKVAVLDSGVYKSQSDIYIDSTYSTSTISYTTDYNDDEGHGTHVAGIIAGRNNGIAGQGVAPGATIHAVKVMNYMGRSEDLSVVRGLGYVLDKNVDNVVNMSLGGYGLNSAYIPVLDDLYSKGIVVVASSGNEGTSEYRWPAAFDNVISVSATKKDNNRTTFSNYGKWVDVCAPGQDIWSTSYNGGYSYELMSGTSMACPVVAGEIAVILSAADSIPELRGKTGPDKVDAVLSILQKNSIKTESGLGSGIPSLTKILSINEAAEKPATPKIYTTVASDYQSVTFDVKTKMGNTLLYTLDGTDPTKSSTASSLSLPSKSDTASITTSAIPSLKSPGSIALNVVAVSPSGVMSSAARASCTLKPYVSSVALNGPATVALGKSVSFTADVAPTYAAVKTLNWKIYYNGITEVTPYNVSSYGVTVKSGKVAATSTARTGSYTVRAIANDGSGTSASKTITVGSADRISSVSFAEKKVIVPRGSSSAYVDLSGYLRGQLINGSSATASDFVWTSSKKDVATVSQSGVVTCYAPGSTTITALAADSSGKKATISVEVVQLVTGLSIACADSKLGSVTSVSASKNLILKESATPSNAKNKKVSWKLFCGSTEITKNNADYYGVSINNGKIATKAGARQSTYTAKAYTTDGSGISASYNFSVIGGYISSLATPKELSDITLFRVEGLYDAPTYKDVQFDVSGYSFSSVNLFNAVSSNPNIVTATVNSVSSSKVTVRVQATGKAAGKSTVTLYAKDGSGKKASTSVVVENPASSLNLSIPSKNDESVRVGTSVAITPKFGTGYGAVNTKTKLRWYVSGAKAQFVSVSPAGTLSVRSIQGHLSWKESDRWITVTAITDDGSNVVGKISIYLSSFNVSAVRLRTWGQGGYRYFDMVPNAKINVPVIGTPEILVIRVLTSYPSTSTYNGYDCMLYAESSNPSVLTTDIIIDSDGDYRLIVQRMYDEYGNAKPGHGTITIYAVNAGNVKKVTYKFQVDKKYDNDY